MVVRILILQLLFVELVHSSGTGEIKFLTYKDDTDCINFPHGDCDFYFKPLNIQDEDGNILHNIAKAVCPDDTNTVDLTKVDALKNPITIKVPTNKTVKIVTTVWDDDGSWSSDDKIREISNFIVPFNGALVSTNWKQAAETRNSPDMKFTVEYRLKECDSNFTGRGCNFCKPNYFTELCDKYCVPVLGNYTCNNTTGEKICVDRKVGPNCDQCISHFTGTDCNECAQYYNPNGTCNVHCKPVPGKYNCSDQGIKVCLRHWNGKDCDLCTLNYFGTNCSKFCNKSSTSYTCDDSGDKNCNPHYYPAKQCDTYCSEVTGAYTCNHTTGEKICEGKRTGVDCVECIQNYYPKDRCDVQCEPDPDQKYTCTDQGEKQCRGNRTGEYCTGCAEHYFGNECLTYCEANGNYMCSDSGHKICLDNTTSVANYCIKVSGQKVTEKVSWSLAGVFLLTTVLITIFAARGFLKQRDAPCDKDLESEHEYVDNIITRLQSSASAVLGDETFYSNGELYEL